MDDLREPKQNGSSRLDGYARWSLELKTLAKEKGLEWLVADDEEWMRYTYEDAATPTEALEELVSEAMRSGE
jgi:hypothetical protein